jgi:uncharacterized PurR-regulated membrane protein YhhQ (DUF165 family)
MSNHEQQGMTAKSALRLEYAIIALGIVALLMIFQPFSITLFTWGAIVVVFAGLINNLLPMAQPGVSTRSVVTVAMVVAMIFCIVLLLSIAAAYLYGAFFLNPPNPDTAAGKVQLNATPWYLHNFTLSVAAVGAILAGLITLRNRKRD